LNVWISLSLNKIPWKNKRNLQKVLKWLNLKAIDHLMKKERLRSSLNLKLQEQIMLLKSKNLDKLWVIKIKRKRKLFYKKESQHHQEERILLKLNLLNLLKLEKIIWKKVLKVHRI